LAEVARPPPRVRVGKIFERGEMRCSCCHEFPSTFCPLQSVSVHHVFQDLVPRRWLQSKDLPHGCVINDVGHWKRKERLSELSYHRAEPTSCLQGRVGMVRNFGGAIPATRANSTRTPRVVLAGFVTACHGFTEARSLVTAATRVRPTSPANVHE